MRWAPGPAAQATMDADDTALGRRANPKPWLGGGLSGDRASGEQSDGSNAHLRQLSVRELVAELTQIVPALQPSPTTTWDVDDDAVTSRLKARRLVAELRRRRAVLHRAGESAVGRRSHW